MSSIKVKFQNEPKSIYLTKDESAPPILELVSENGEVAATLSADGCRTLARILEAIATLKS